MNNNQLIVVYIHKGQDEQQNILFIRNLKTTSKKSTHAHGKGMNHMAAFNSIYVIFPCSVKHFYVIRFPHVMIKCALVCLR